jgi:indole-3-glycerol phosphate synthase
MILDEIITYKKEELERQKGERSLSDLKSRLPDLAPIRNFKEAISRPNRINIIAEIKKASPSAGVIRKEFDPVEIAGTYASSGASAISVLTDEKFFQGSVNFLSQIKAEVDLPLLRKDFVIDEYQIYQSRLKGADAILLIVSVLDREKLKEFIGLAHFLGLDCIVEIHNIDELNQALETDAKIIGINNRDLRTFEVNLDTTLKLAKHIPQDRIIISESGIRSREDIVRLKEKGVSAFLIGEALIKEDNISQKLKKLLA